MRTVLSSARLLGLILAATTLGSGGGSALGDDRAAPYKIKSTTHQLTATSIVVPASFAHFEISANDGSKISITLTGLAKLVDTARFHVNNNVLTIRDDSRQLDYTIVSDRQNIIVGSSNVIINNIGPSSGTTNRKYKYSKKEMELLPLTYKVSVPRRIAIQLERARGRVLLQGLEGKQQVTLSGNGVLTGERLAGRLSLHAMENAAATVGDGKLERLSIVAAENAEVEYSGAARQASLSVTGNASIEFSGTADTADLKATENGEITAHGNIKSVTRKKTGNAEIDIR
jgi:hypothetical protein